MLPLVFSLFMVAISSRLTGKMMDYGFKKEKKNKNFKIANRCRYCKKGS